MTKSKDTIPKNNSKKEPRRILGTKQDLEAKIPIQMNRKYQDSFFCSLFRIPKYRRAAYLLMHPEDTDISDSEFVNIELENIFTIDMYNDVCFLVRGRLIILMEHQSTLNCNMPMRALLYVVEEYKKLLSMEKYKGAVHGTELVQFPKPEFYMVYTGKGDCPEYLKLSDAFANGGKSALELVITVYKEDNAEGIIKEFISLISLIKASVANGITMEEAVKTAIKKYRSGYEISDYFDGREDVFEMLGEALTLEEMLDLRDEANARVITQRVTEQVTEQMTIQDICKAFKMMKSLGADSESAMQAIMKEYNMPLQKVMDILA